MSNNNQLTNIHNSKKSYIIYKSNKGFNLYTNFSKKIILNNKNIIGFLNRKNDKKKLKKTDLFIGFLGYELLNNLIGVKVPKQKNISLNNNLKYKNKIDFKFNNNFKLNINKDSYKKIFNKFKKKIKKEY